MAQWTQFSITDTPYIIIGSLCREWELPLVEERQFPNLNCGQAALSVLKE